MNDVDKIVIDLAGPMWTFVIFGLAAITLLLWILVSLRELLATMREIAREKTHITFTTKCDEFGGAARRRSVEGRANDY